MKLQFLIATGMAGLLALTGCKQDEPTVQAAPIHRSWLSLPALPIIQDAVFSLSPTFNGQRNTWVMAQLCGLARGELKQEQVNVFLAQQKVDVAKLPKQGHELSLLVNGDRAGQATACAAYLATSVLSTVDAGEFMSAVRPMGADGKTPDQDAKPHLQIDNARLSAVLPIKLAEARANADVFALIAAELQRRPGLKVSEYREQAEQLFSQLAPTYLERIKAQLPPAGSTYKLLQLDADRFAFSSSAGSLFEYGSEGMTLRQNSVIWYGQGKLLGQEYPLQVAYFDASVGSLLAPVAKQ